MSASIWYIIGAAMISVLKVMALFSHSSPIFFLKNCRKQVNLGLKNWVVVFPHARFVELEECFDLVYYRPRTISGSKFMAVFSHSFRFFFLQNWWKQVNFGLKNWVVGFRPARFVELDECFDLVYYRPSNDFWIKSYGRIQSQFYDFFSSKTDENKWISA